MKREKNSEKEEEIVVTEAVVMAEKNICKQTHTHKRKYTQVECMKKEETKIMKKKNAKSKNIQQSYNTLTYV